MTMALPEESPSGTFEFRERMREFASAFLHHLAKRKEGELSPDEAELEASQLLAYMHELLREAGNQALVACFTEKPSGADYTLLLFDVKGSRVIEFPLGGKALSYRFEPEDEEFLKNL